MSSDFIQSEDGFKSSKSNTSYTINFPDKNDTQCEDEEEELENVLYEIIDRRNHLNPKPTQLQFITSAFFISLLICCLVWELHRKDMTLFAA